jgi:hypothetical protein
VHFPRSRPQVLDVGVLDDILIVSSHIESPNVLFI